MRKNTGFQTRKRGSLVPQRKCDQGFHVGSRLQSLALITFGSILSFKQCAYSETTIRNIIRNIFVPSIRTLYVIIIVICVVIVSGGCGRKNINQNLHRLYTGPQLSTNELCLVSGEEGVSIDSINGRKINIGFWGFQRESGGWRGGAIMELLPGKYNMMVNLYRHTLSYPVSTTISSKWPVPLEFACERGHAYFIDYQVSDHSTFWSTKKSWNPNIKDVTSDYMGSSLKGERDIRVIKQMEMKNELTETNKKKGEEFLANNRYKEGVITLPSGLQYKVINTGKGKIPNLTDTVEVHYRGTLINGTEFDSSYKRGQMANFTVNRVIPGWVEALLKMREGDKWRLFVPSHLAYGERGAGRAIEPNAVLIFEVELITVK